MLLLSKKKYHRSWPIIESSRSRSFVSSLRKGWLSFPFEKKVSSLKGNVLKGGLSRGWKFSSRNYITRYRDSEISRDGIQLRFYRCDKAIEAVLVLSGEGREPRHDIVGRRKDSLEYRAPLFLPRLKRRRVRSTRVAAEFIERPR